MSKFSHQLEPGGISVVIPVLNGERYLHKLAAGLARMLPGLHQPFEVIFVDDGSSDGSWGTIRETCDHFDFAKGIRLMRNYGQHNALLAGIRLAKYSVTVTMDDDLQHPPEEIPKLLEMLGEDFDVVYGIPEQQRHGFWRDLASWATKCILQSTLKVKSVGIVSAFRAFKTELRDAFSSYNGPFVNIDVLLTWGTCRLGGVTVRHEPRELGASNYNFARLFIHAINMLTGFSVAPLRLASIVGFVFTLFGGAILFYVMGRFVLQGSTVAGFPFLASIVALFSGAQLFAIGIIGEYLARMYHRSMDKPSYTIAGGLLDKTEP